MEKEVNKLVSDTINGLKNVIDSNTIIGSPITLTKDTIIVPITKVSVGFVSGGGELNTIKSKINAYPFVGASTSGFNLSPIGFISFVGGEIKFHDIDSKSIDEKIVDMINNIVSKITEEGEVWKNP